MSQSYSYRNAAAGPAASGFSVWEGSGKWNWDAYVGSHGETGTAESEVGARALAQLALERLRSIARLNRERGLGG